MLSAALVALTWCPSLVGLGALAGRGVAPDLRPGIFGLLGLGVAGTLAGAVHLVAPAGPWVSAAIWTAGLAALVARRAEVREGLRAGDLAAAIAATLAASLAMRQPEFQFDTGYYHLQALRWTTDHPLTRGLANVHHRLGFNSHWTLVAAALEHPLARGRSPFFLNQLPVAFGALVSLAGLRRLVAGRRGFPDLMLAATALPVASATFAIGGLYVDYTAGIVVWVALALWAAAVERREEFEDAAVAPTLLTTLALLLKITAAPLAAGAAVLLLFRRRALSSRWWTGAAAPSAAAAIPWAAHGIATSGCLAFPVAATCLGGLPWAIPPAKARAAADGIRAFAQQPAWEPDGTFAWLEEWPARILRHYPEAPLWLAAVALGVLLLVARRRRLPGAAAWILAVSTGATALWFLSAPEPRFAMGFLHALALTPLLAFVSASPLLARRAVRLASGASLLAAALALGLALDGRPRSGTLFGLGPWRPPLLAWPEIPREATRAVTTSGGVRVLVPLESDWCGDVSPPCTPAAELDLGLRLEGGAFRAGVTPRLVGP